MNDQPINTQPSDEEQDLDLSLDEFSIVELEDRLEFLIKSDNRSN